MGNTLTIVEAHAKLKAKEITSEQLVQSCIDRIESVDGKLNAVVYKNFERALEQAKKIDAAGKFDHPLTGIPFLTKDVYCEKGIPTTACSNVLRSKDYAPPFDCTTIQRLHAVGAISIGKTNTDEFTQGASTETSCYGVTKNPWDTSCVAGGSSGGSAAAVAADECIFALGTDTGGSIRQPAAFCGCTGIRPTYGRTSRYGVMSMASSLDTIGPLCKSIEDMAIVLEAISGKDPLDATTGDTEVPQYAGTLNGDIKGMKLGLPKEYFSDGMNEEMKTAVMDAVEVLKNLGAEIIDISLPHTEYATPCYYVICPSEVSSNMARYDGIRFGHTVSGADDLVDYYHKTRTEGFGDEVKRRIMIGTYALSAGYYDAYYRQALKVRTLIKKDFEDAYQSVDAIIAPVTPSAAFTIGTHEGDPVAMYLEDVFLDPQVMAGIPALSVPCGETKEGLPLGLQIMGKQWGESEILNIAHAYEQATDWNEKKPNL
ncbi:MAG: Asp-tRNA(Asn)/Glu-tRNA(Gln) amidotransferase subunit GatA [Candidatus Peribacter sp.]|jgi:aspartyl-tRNA(Asn)/glutamyl-tRNA(Gln) amidotransferase subunit A|nr:Asp-tRNA(Asn)/Glu-tRNA(Gln) amidotransferase subunit GatA [Candidatus Peribacter sp.]MBT4393479.1 Asp-tRNA(Asn)/Glu-tRNA(Gln) amidotransferase subunit GatA [Candidatus Peribacter sp.]MBT4600838.1 Asp-tRNA(Asn)/Glu-tRNA(Gln) amidotransferase subunit GatA [Candidatus Peribacter sp.]MBT5149485.1 Asp-tRNA(Asn)/Glu-tRNA(Gln) amidotransferase subunit GatA [Candidatus Peribacter sp.]MBT5637316.1 Asp-tRNA(Asn)/Glu-tRNA(Gln) amidotransferase subunit GatA [Candidatus Peribacter sp.]